MATPSMVDCFASNAEIRCRRSSGVVTMTSVVRLCIDLVAINFRQQPPGEPSLRVEMHPRRPVIIRRRGETAFDRPLGEHMSHDDAGRLYAARIRDVGSATDELCGRLACPARRRRRPGTHRPPRPHKFRRPLPRYRWTAARSVSVDRRQRRESRRKVWRGRLAHVYSERSSSTVGIFLTSMMSGLAGRGYSLHAGPSGARRGGGKTRAFLIER